MSNYAIAPEAELDLNEIWECIAEDSASAADRWIGQLEAVFSLLAGAPGSGTNAMTGRTSRSCSGLWAHTW